MSGAYDEDAPYQHLDTHIKRSEADYEECNRIFYMALPPTVFVPVAKKIRAHLMDQTGYKRVIVEKPFGRDSASAAELTGALRELFEESQMYLIDHYLGALARWLRHRACPLPCYHYRCPVCARVCLCVCSPPVCAA